MKNITVIPSFSGSPIHKKSWSLGINQGRAIYCFTLPLSTWTASCVVDSDHHHHHHCSYDVLRRTKLSSSLIPSLPIISTITPPFIVHLRLWPWRNWPLTYSLMISSMMQCFPNVGSASQARNVEPGCQTATTFSLVWLFIKVHGVMLCSRNARFQMIYPDEFVWTILPEQVTKSWQFCCFPLSIKDTFFWGANAVISMKRCKIPDKMQKATLLNRCISHICDILHVWYIGCVGCLKWSKFCNWCS